MAIQVKRRRRLVLLLAGIAAVMALGGGVYLFRQNQIRQEELGYRDEGLKAMEEGRDLEAVRALGKYLSRNPEDAEVTYKCIQARLRVPEPDGKHLTQAMSLLQRLLSLQPDHPEARRMLLDVYVQAQFNAETVKLAGELLKKDADDVEAVLAKINAMLALRQFQDLIGYVDQLLMDRPEGSTGKKSQVRMEAIRGKAMALTSIDRFGDALQYAEQFNQAKPLDLEGHLLTLHLLRQTQYPLEQIVARAEDLREANPDNPVFELLQAAAYRLANDHTNAVHWLRAVVDRKPTDELLLSRLVGELDAAELFPDVITVLHAAADKVQGLGLRRVLVHRLVQAGQREKVLGYLSQINMDPQSPSTDSELMGLQAMILFELDRDEEAGAILQALAGRTNDKVAAAWDPFLRKVVAADQPTASQIVEACGTSLERQPGNPFFYYSLGQGFAMLGETDLALEAWRAAAGNAPSWSMPLIQIARVLIDSDRALEAVPVAEAALKRSPGNLAAASALVVAAAANLDQLPEGKLEELLNYVNQIQQEVPGEGQTLPVQVMLLARAGRADQAKEVIQKALAQQTPPSESALLRLAAVSRDANLGLEDAIMQRCALSPQVAYERAVALWNSGQPEKGLGLIESAGQSQGGDAVAWALARASYLDRIQDPRAAANWVELGDRNPKDARVQRAVLGSQVAWGNREFTDRTIDRLRLSTSEAGTAWRVARARWIIQGPPDSVQLTRAGELLNEVIRIAPHLIEPRVLLAQVYVQLDNESGATQQLMQAAQMRPDSVEIKLELARLHQRRGEFDQVRNLLGSVAVSGNNTALVERAAEMLASQGDTGRAIEMLKSTVNQPGDHSPAKLLLASLYWQRGESKQAEQIVAGLLEKPTVSVVQFAVGFYLSQGEQDLAERVLALLDSMQLEPGVREQTRGDFYTQTNQTELAVKELRSATQLAPQNADLWKRLIAHHIDQGQVPEAVEVAREGLKAIPGDEGLKSLVDDADLAVRSGENPLLRPMIFSLLGDSAVRGSAKEALQAVVDAEKDKRSNQEVVAALRRLANSNARFLPLQLLAAQLSVAVGDYDAAVLIGTRTMGAFPRAEAPARLAAEALAGAGRWDEVLPVAEEWQRRSLGKSVQADLMVAEAKLRLGDSRSASAGLKPLLEQAMQKPDEYIQVITQYARTLIASGDVQQAHDLLLPLMGRSASWRAAWMTLAVQDVPTKEVSTAWLETITQHIPQDQFDERLMQVQGWNTASKRFEDPQLRQRADQLMEQIVQDPAAIARCWMVRGIMAETAEGGGRLDVAEASYRKALELNPELHVAMNNLAMLLANKGADLDQAVQLAKAAVQASPRNPNYHDTLASVYAKSGDHAAAMTSIDAAIQLEPTNPVWQSRKRELQSQAGHAVPTGG